MSNLISSAAVVMFVFLTNGGNANAERLGWKEAGCKKLGKLGEIIDCTNLALTQVPDFPPITTHVWLSMNKITAITSEDFVRLKSLKYLYLDENKLQTIAADAFKKQTQLTTLLLDGNEISTIPTGLFLQCQKLSYLDLKNNKLKAIEASTFYGLEAIQHLNLYDNAISRIECGSFNAVETATYINANANPSVCEIDQHVGTFQCACLEGQFGGKHGYCSSDQSCAWEEPNFRNFEVVTTTTASPETTDSEVARQHFVFGFEDDENGSVIHNDTFSETAVQDEESSSDSSNDGEFNPALIAGVAVCIAGVMAAFGTVFVRQYRSQKELLKIESGSIAFSSRQNTAFSSRQNTTDSDTSTIDSDTSTLELSGQSTVFSRQGTLNSVYSRQSTINSCHNSDDDLQPADVNAFPMVTDPSNPKDFSNLSTQNTSLGSSDMRASVGDSVSDWIRTPSECADGQVDDRKSQEGSSVGSYRTSYMSVFRGGGEHVK